jgi:hypothetical protein
MKFTKIRVNGLTAVDLPIVNALPSDVYILKNVDGLGPPEVDVSIADTLNAGGYYQGRRPQSRQIVMKIGLNPDFSAGQTASDLRASLYGMLTPGAADNLTIQIMDGAVVLVQTQGYVAKMEINPFSKDPEVQVTIDCVGWYLEAPNLLYVAPASKAVPAILTGPGAAPSGIHLEVIFTTNLSSWTLTNAAGKKMLVTYAFLTNDKLAIDTRPGARGIWLTRGGVTTNIIYALSTDSTWLMLHGGNNEFTTSSASFNWGDVYYLPQYWGI